ncbi:MAG: phenylalanine--tRNA ligase subunit beta [Desulfomonilia bacterium]
MKIGYKWLKDYVDLDQDAYEVARALTMSGTEVEEVIHETIPREVICARITKVWQHPDAEKLLMCLVDTGTEELQVVCGAPNTRVGLMSAFAPVGTVLGQGMKVKKAKIRGQESFGVLLSERELSLTDDHTGIMELPEDVTPGEVLLDALDLEDWVLDLNVTPNRGDCLSVIGIARELSAIFKKDLVLPSSLISEDATPIESALKVEILSPDACPRYAARVMKDVRIKKSPFSMRRRLYQAGMRAISNVVDITNYVLLEYGQPLHAFDYTFLEDQAIIVRKARGKEPFITLDSAERILGEDDLLICDGKKPVALAGIMGGENSEVLETTTSIVLESAFFNPVGIRKTAKGMNISTEASYRFERGIDPSIQVDAANRAAYLMAQLAGVTVLKGVLDVNNIPAENREIPLRKGYMETVLGIGDIHPDDVTGIFTRLGCTLRTVDTGWHITTPPFRHDLRREIDLVEEFIRIYGMDNVPTELPRFNPVKISNLERKYRELRVRLASMGLSEVVTYSFISPKWNRFFPGDTLELINPISDEMKTMRTSLIPGLAMTVERNKKLQRRDVSIFEIGRCFIPAKEQKLPDEHCRIGIALSGQRTETHWSEKPSPVDFYDIKGIAESLIPGIELRASDHGFFQEGNQADVLFDGDVIGSIGCLHRDIQAILDIADDVYVMELDTEPVLERPWKGLTEIPKFPLTWRDISLVVNESTSYADIVGIIGSMGIREIRQVAPIDLYTGDKLPRGKKGITIRITYQSDSRTLEDKTISAWQDSILNTLEKDLGIQLRT